MLKNMLKAVSSMIADSTDPKVQCAKTIVDELIEGLQASNKKDLKWNEFKAPSPFNEKFIEPLLPVSIPDSRPIELEPEKKKAKPGRPKKEQKAYEVSVREGRLIEVVGLPDESLIDLDGVIMTHAKAKGRSFQNAQIL